MNRTVVIMGALLVIVAVGGGSFWAGMKMEENRLVQDPARFMNMLIGREGGQFPRQFPGRIPVMVGTPQPGQEAAAFRGGIMGTIEAIEGDTLIISNDEGEVRVQTTDTTLIEKYTSVGVEDLEAGEQVVVAGSRNDNGSITARSIRISTAP